MILKEDNILYEDSQIIVCRKPPGIATQTARLGEQDMVSVVKNYLKTPYIGLVHRLDQPVEGILVFGKTTEAAAKLSAQSMEKRYYAVVLADAAAADREKEGSVKKERTLVDYVVKNSRDNTSRIAEKKDKDAKRAELKYCIVKTKEEDRNTGNIRMLAEVSLVTGRHHQIRVQMSHAGMPLLGDMKYGNETSLQKNRESNIKEVALCAYSLAFLHPETGKSMRFSIVPQGKVFQPFLPVNP